MAASEFHVSQRKYRQITNRKVKRGKTQISNTFVVEESKSSKKKLGDIESQKRRSNAGELLFYFISFISTTVLKRGRFKTSKSV